MELKDDLKIPPELVWRKVDDNTVVVSPKIGKVRVLNNIGSLIWEQLVAGQTIDAIQDIIVDQYDITPEQARHDLQNFLVDLQERGLLQ